MLPSAGPRRRQAYLKLALAQQRCFPRERQQQRSEERREDALGRDMKSQEDHGLLDDKTECTESPRSREGSRNPSVASGSGCLEVAARAELGIESDKEWAEARANFLSYVTLLREWHERSVESGALHEPDLPNAA